MPTSPPTKHRLWLRASPDAGELERLIFRHLGQAVAASAQVCLVDEGPADTIWQHDHPGQPPCQGSRMLTFVAAASGASKALARHLIGEGDRIIAASRWSRDRIVENGIPASRVAIVPHGVDPLMFAPLTEAERAAARARLGLRDGELALLNITDHHRDGGLDLVIRALARLHRRGVAARLVLLDDGAGLDHGAIIAHAAGAESGGIPAETLESIILVAGGVARDELRYLHGAADCFVSPYRAAHFNLPVLEAIATGTPVIVTAGGCTDDFCDDDVAWRIPAEPHLAMDGMTGTLRRWLEPDLDQLTAALAAVIGGHGFDRLRFAQARVQRLRQANWSHAAAALLHLLGGADSAAQDLVQVPVIGLPIQPGPEPVMQPVTTPPESVPIAVRPAAWRRPAGADARLLSVVVQGPCHRDATDGVPSIDTCLASLRRSFPGAQIIVSTWLGSDIDGLDADDIVLNHDPGPLAHPVQPPCNINRMVTSTANGLAAATRPFCIKTRSDVLFTSDALASRELWRAARHLSLERRIGTTSLGTWRLAAFLRPFQVGDMVQHGATDDLRLLWAAPAQSWQDIFLPDPAAFLPRLNPEQALLTGYLARIGRPAGLAFTLDGRWEVIAASLDLCLGGFDVFDEAVAGVVFPRRLAVVREIVEAETAASFSSLRGAFSHDRMVTTNSVFAAFHETLRQKISK
jgi:glycosyltransferase involved in cell wall biosynthesis